LNVGSCLNIGVDAVYFDYVKRRDSDAFPAFLDFTRSRKAIDVEKTEPQSSEAVAFSNKCLIYLGFCMRLEPASTVACLQKAVDY
jgi:hypothetical protein